MRAAVAAVAVFGATTAQGAATQSRSCDAPTTRATWTAFLSAFNRGDREQLDALFAAEPEFGWYSSNIPGLRNLAAARNRATLIPYFHARHARRDRMQLLSFAYHGDGDFTYRIRRSASDYKRGAWFRVIGKGAVTCTDSGAALIVVSVGGPGSG